MVFDRQPVHVSSLFKLWLEAPEGASFLGVSLIYRKEGLCLHLLYFVRPDLPLRLLLLSFSWMKVRVSHLSIICDWFCFFSLWEVKTLWLSEDTSVKLVTFMLRMSVFTQNEWQYWVFLAIVLVWENHSKRHCNHSFWWETNTQFDKRLSLQSMINCHLISWTKGIDFIPKLHSILCSADTQSYVQKTLGFMDYRLQYVRMMAIQISTYKCSHYCNMSK